eukprot:2991316-Lingulodinium_polyedra.AAC.1
MAMLDAMPAEPAIQPQQDTEEELVPKHLKLDDADMRILEGTRAKLARKVPAPPAGDGAPELNL